jgi:hypothetical protein
MYLRIVRNGPHSAVSYSHIRSMSAFSYVSYPHPEHICIRSCISSCIRIHIRIRDSCPHSDVL